MIDSIRWSWRYHTNAVLIGSAVGILLADYIIGSIRASNLYGLSDTPISLMTKLSCGISLAGFVLAVLLIVAWCCFLNYLLRDPQSKKEALNREFAKTHEHGSARTMEKHEAEDFFKVQKLDLNCTDMILGWADKSKNLVYTYDTRKKGKNANATMCGSPGTGKTLSHVYPYIIQAVAREESFIVTDCSGETPEHLANYCRAKGYEVRILNFIEPAKSDGVNIFDMFDLVEGKDIVMTANKMAALISANCCKDGESYFSQATESFISFMLVYVYMAEDMANTLPSMYELALKPIDDLKDLLNGLSDENPIQIAASAWVSLPKQQEQTRATVQSWLKSLSAPAVKNMLSHSDTSFTAPGEKKCGYFICVPPSTRDLDWIPALICGSMLSALIEDVAYRKPGKALDVTVTFLFDEFPNIFQIPGWTRILNNIRKHRINAIMLFQGMQDLERSYPDSFRSILNACHLNIFCGTNDIETAKKYSDWSGEATVVTQRTTKLSGSLLNMEYPTVSESTTGTNTLTSDMLMGLNRDGVYRAAIFAFAQHVYIVDAIFWEDLPAFKEIKALGYEQPEEHIPIYLQREGKAPIPNVKKDKGTEGKKDPDGNGKTEPQSPDNKKGENPDNTGKPETNTPYSTPQNDKSYYYDGWRKKKEKEEKNKNNNAEGSAGSKGKHGLGAIKT